MASDEIPRLADWLAQHRSRPAPTEVIVATYDLIEPTPATSDAGMAAGQVAVDIVRYESPARSGPRDNAHYVMGVDSQGQHLWDQWFESEEAARDAILRGEYGEATERPHPDQDYLLVGGDHGRRKASFRLMGDQLDPEALARITGASPSKAHRKGDPRPLPNGKTGTHRSGLWSLDTSGQLADDAGLDEHLRWLLDRLEPSREALKAAIAEQGLTADFFCGYFMESWNNGFSLSADTLARVAELGAKLGIDIYGP
jgi:hypothetical protein